MKLLPLIGAVSYLLGALLPAVSVAQPDEKLLKHKVAIGRFTNETRYGGSLLRDADLDPLGKQAADIMTAYMVQTEKFLVLERTDLSKIAREQDLQGSQAGVVGADTLILGSIVEFGRSEDGQRGLFNRKRVQSATAKVAIRLVDVRTGVAFHSATGEGSATNETKTVLGIGSTARFDGTLTDKAIAVAIEDVIEDLVNSLQSRPWRTDILQVEGGTVFISGGKSQGIAPGQQLYVMRSGKTIKSQQTGFNIELPPEQIAVLQVQSTFGDNETNEGSVTRLLEGVLEQGQPSGLFVTDRRDLAG